MQQIVLPIKDSNVLKMVQDTLPDSFQAGRRNYTIFQVGKSGIIDTLVAQIDDALVAREIVKVKVLENGSAELGCGYYLFYAMCIKDNFLFL